jgi:hypothetical protein
MFDAVQEAIKIVAQARARVGDASLGSRILHREEGRMGVQGVVSNVRSLVGPHAGCSMVAFDIVCDDGEVVELRAFNSRLRAFLQMRSDLVVVAVARIIRGEWIVTHISALAPR